MKLICLILIQLVFGVSLAQAQDAKAKHPKKKRVHVVNFAAKPARQRYAKRSKKSHQTVYIVADNKPERRVISVDFGGGDDNYIEPKMSVPQKAANKSAAAVSPRDEKMYSSDKDFGTSNDGKYNKRSIASVDNEKPQPISMKKALNTFKKESERDLNDSYE